MNNELSQCQLDYLKTTVEELEEKMTDWLEKPVRVIVFKTDDEALVDPEQSYDEYVAVMYVEDVELVSFTDESAIDVVDLVSIWAIRHLIISCGSHNKKLELPEPARA